jgi:hypothetical protein
MRLDVTDTNGWRIHGHRCVCEFVSVLLCVRLFVSVCECLCVWICVYNWSTRDFIVLGGRFEAQTRCVRICVRVCVRASATPLRCVPLGEGAGPEMEPSEQEEEAPGSRPELALMVSASRRLHQQGPPPRMQSSVAAGILPPPPSSPPKQGPPYLSTQRTHTTCCAGTLTHSRQGQAHAPERSVQRQIRQFLSSCGAKTTKFDLRVQLNYVMYLGGRFERGVTWTWVNFKHGDGSFVLRQYGGLTVSSIRVFCFRFSQKLFIQVCTQNIYYLDTLNTCSLWGLIAVHTTGSAHKYIVNSHVHILLRKPATYLKSQLFKEHLHTFCSRCEQSMM